MKIFGVGGDGILYYEKLVYAQMPLADTKRFLTSSCVKSQESEGASPLDFFAETIYAFQSWIQVPTDGAGLSLSERCPAAYFLVYFTFIFPSKKWLKEKRVSMPVRFTEIPWNAAVTFIISLLLRRLRSMQHGVQLCWWATGCQQECKSKAATLAFPSP